MRSIATLAVVVSQLVPGVRAAAAADAPVEEARIRFQRGVQLFHEGSFEAALAEFRKAYQVAPSYRLLYNIGQVHYELHDYVGALRSFRRYLSDGKGDIRADRRAAVETEIRKLEGLVAYLDVTVHPAGADIMVDDVVVGIAPLDMPLLVNAGQRRVTASVAGRSAPTRAITVAGGERIQVVLDVPDAAPPVVPVPRPLPLAVGVRAREYENPRMGVWIGVAVTGALALTAGGFAFATQQARHNFDNELDTFPTYRERIEYFRSRMVNLATVTDVLGAGALLAGGVTLYLAVGRGDESRRNAGGSAAGVPSWEVWNPVRVPGQSDRTRRPTPRKVAVRLLPAGLAVAGGF